MLFGAGTSPPAPLPQTGHTKQPHNLASKFKLLSKEEMAALDAKAHVGLFATVPHQHPPYTRAKYLEYFSFVPYEKVPQTQMNGGSRSAQMGRVLRLPFTDRKAAEEAKLAAEKKAKDAQKIGDIDANATKQLQG